LTRLPKLTPPAAFLAEGPSSLVMNCLIMRES
jgi:hypothetical protein